MKAAKFLSIIAGAIMFLAPITVEAGSGGLTTSSIENVVENSNDHSSGEYLGCAVDEQQCASRAANSGYPRYYAERSYLCPNAAKFACWGQNQLDEELEQNYEEDLYVNCSYYVKPATCASHRECKWVGSCVPR